MHAATTRHGAPNCVCTADRLAFPIRDGIPVMLENEARARPADDDDAGRRRGAHDASPS